MLHRDVRCRLGLISELSISGCFIDRGHLEELDVTEGPLFWRESAAHYRCRRWGVRRKPGFTDRPGRGVAAAERDVPNFQSLHRGILVGGT